ncbi:MAG TPA: alpha-N-arabinofuranosidase [Rectinemataceae bacterium]|nr:alpha-N-arabinofuranosidase [Rectinemataceae bacterium]
MKARAGIDRAFRIGEVDPRLFGSFVEHLGRAVYGGIYQPDHPSADARGFRGDVLALVRELGIPLVRYPGGNFVSSFNWEDSVGAPGDRPTRLDLAWRSVEPNRFGLQEFLSWCGEAGAQPMLAVNLGTRGIDAARELVEYCNFPSGTRLSDLRRSHGAESPYGVELWCLGNEMDGPWQVGQKTAREYGRLARESAKAMRLVDPQLELVACGSSYPAMPSFPRWEAEVLDECYDQVEYLSLHSYYGNEAGDRMEYLAAAEGMDGFIRSVRAVCDFVKADKRSGKTMKLAFDEWNVWYHTKAEDRHEAPWQIGPRLLEEHYTFDDALVVGSLLITLLRHADRVKIACMAQLVNVIAPIMTEPDGPAWRQTTFYPFLHASRYGRGISLDLRVESPSYDTKTYGSVPYLTAAAVLDEEAGELAIFAVNRSPTEGLELDLGLSGFAGWRVFEHIEYRADHAAARGASQSRQSRPGEEAAPGQELPEGDVPGRCLPGRRLPERRSDLPSLQGDRLVAGLAALSWNVLRLSAPARSE